MATALSIFKKYIAPDVLPCPDPIVERELIGTIIDFYERTHVITKDFNVELDSDDIDSDYQDSIDIDLNEYFTNYRPVSVIRLNVDGRDYTPKYKEILNDLDAWESSVREEDVKFFFFLTNSSMRVYDMETSDSNLYIRMAIKPTRDITEVEDESIYEDHLETIVAGVKARVLRMPGKPWTNQTAARQADIDWRRGTSKARLRFDKGYTNNPQTVNPQSFGQLN
jgi:nucleoside diphosphate kinase